MIYWCKECDSVFELSEDYVRDHEECPKTGCWGDLIQVDELMLPVIRILNRKGYETQYCCSGHVNSPGGTTAYLCFQAGANPLGDGMTVQQMVQEVGEDGTRRILRACWEESLELYNQIKGTLPRPWVMELPGAYYWGPPETLGEQMQRDQAQGVYKVPRNYMNILGEGDEGFETYWEEIQRVLDLYMERRGKEAEKLEWGENPLILDFRICIRPRLESWNDLGDRWIQIRDFDRLPELCEPLAEKWGYLPDKKFQFTLDKLLKTAEQRRLSPFEQEMAEACEEKNHWLAGEPEEPSKIQAVGEYLELKHLGALERYSLSAEPTFVGSFLLDWVVPQYMSPDSMERCSDRDPKEFMDLVRPIEMTSPGGLIERVLDLDREDVWAVSRVAKELREFFEKLISWWGPLQLTENQNEKVDDPEYILEVFGFKRSVELTEDEKAYRDYRKLVKANAQLMQWAVSLEEWHE